MTFGRSMLPTPMLLSIETTEKFGSVALLDGGRLLRELRLPTSDRSAKTLAPALDCLLRGEHCLPADIMAVAVVVGPGSFTGLRVGVATAKAFAYAIGAKVVAVDTMRTVAAGVPFRDGFLSVGVDAQRGDVVAQTFELSPEGPQPVSERRLIAVADWWNEKERYPQIVFTGPALDRFRTKVSEGAILADESLWTPKASVAGRLAAMRLATGESDDLQSLVPIYSRLSAAEERRLPAIS